MQKYLLFARNELITRIKKACEEIRIDISFANLLSFDQITHEYKYA